MEYLHLLQRRALQQLFYARPGVQNLRLLSQTSQQPFRTRPSQFSTFNRISQNHRQNQSPFFRAARRRFHNTSRRFAEPAPSEAIPEAKLSLSQRLKKLSRDYGWSALGVYLALTAIDLPFCFLAVQLLGPDRVGHWEHVAVSYIKEWITWPMGGNEEAKDVVEDVIDKGEEIVKAPLEEVREGEKRVLEEDETYVVAEHGYREAAEAAEGANASLWTQFALAYAIHKTFIFVRVPLTAAITPKVVKTLRGWGWNIGKMPKLKTKSKTGVNTKGSGVKPDD